LAGARQTVRDEGQPGSCPACEALAFAARRARQMVVDGLNDPAQARLYSEHDGICLPHFLQAAPALEQSTLKPLAVRLLRSLREGEGPALVSLLAGIDPDAPCRASWRDRLPDRQAAGSTLEEFSSRLEIEACPVCLSTGLIERGYVRWFLERTAEDDPSLGNDPGELCFAHLHDLALADHSLAGAAIEHKRATRIGQLERLLSRLAELPSPARRGRRGSVDELDRARDGLMEVPYCPACKARDGIERSQLELVVAALALTPLRERYEHSHGLCVRHTMEVRDGQAARVARRHVDGRLGLLTWEVNETARKYAWAYRHEAAGPEQDAWLRALAQLDGRVFEGTAAVAGVLRARPEQPRIRSSMRGPTRCPRRSSTAS
jgi:hypothetical protein